MEETDEELMEKVRRGDERAYEVIYKRHLEKTKRIIGRLVSGDANVEDVAQRAFLQLWERSGDYDPSKGKLRAWLLRIARCRALDYVRSSACYARVTDRYEESIDGQPKNNGEKFIQADTSTGIDLSKDQMLILAEAMAQIPPLQAQALRLVMDGLSQRQIANQLGLPLGTVKTRIDLGTRAVKRYVNCKLGNS